jgi:phosphatidylglycerophosphatase A
MKFIADWISSGFGSGYARFIPGTFGSAAALIFWWLLHRIGLPTSTSAQLLLVAITVLIGTASVAYSIQGQDSATDPQWIVIDEWAGLFLTLVGIMPTEWAWVVIGFILFRVFDAIKWGPVGALEKLPGAFGIMGDDLMAGALAAACIWIIRGVWGV